MLNAYSDEASLEKKVANGRARELIGGLWHELGVLQAQFLRSRGLLAEHRVLDLGCGCLRAGVKLVPLVHAGNYYGIDVSPSLLKAGREELTACGLTQRVPESNLRATSSFDLSGFPSFDFGIAQSVFTHLPLTEFADCLVRIKPKFVEGRFFATFFIAPHGCAEFLHPGGTMTHPDKDPFHFEFDQIAAAAYGQGWNSKWIGDWSHPRSQQMIEFVVR